MPEEKKLVGKVSHFFDKINVAAIELTDTLRVGDTMSIEGATTQVAQKVESMQIEKQSVLQASSGQAVGIKVGAKVRPGDKVYVVT